MMTVTIDVNGNAIARVEIVNTGQHANGSVVFAQDDRGGVRRYRWAVQAGDPALVGRSGTVLHPRSDGALKLVAAVLADATDLLP